MPVSIVSAVFCKSTNTFTALIRGKCVVLLNLLPVILASTFLAPSHAAAAQTEELEKLEQEYRQLSEEFYRHQAKQQSTARTVDELYRKVKAAANADQSVAAVTSIIANLNLIKANTGDPKVQYVVTRLLEQNAWHAVEILFEHAVESGDPYTTSKFNYLYANYYFDRKAWDKAQQYLSAIEVQNALTRAESDYATIMRGIILQMHKKHRESVKHYDSITDASDYYTYAQLNKAIAFIRQGWWTDAHIAISNALEKGSPKSLEELSNRLYLVLGYSQLQHEFYRDARQTFRNIALDSQYVNRALLGIGLCALHQGDFVGALNAFKLLQSKKQDDIFVTESYLLLAFVYEQMGQETTASAHYSEAIAYYQSRIASAEMEMAKIHGRLTGPGSGFTDREISDNLLRELPGHVLANARQLDFFSRATTNEQLTKKIAALKQKYDSALLLLSRDLVEEQTRVLQSYLSQSQFGVAKLFDSDQ